jgi:hypothetical protein
MLRRQVGIEKGRYFEASVCQDNVKAFSAGLHLLQKVGKEITLGN